MLDSLIETLSLVQSFGSETIQRSPYLKSLFQTLTTAEDVFTENHIPHFNEVVSVNQRDVIFSNAIFTQCHGILITNLFDFVGCHISWICSSSGAQISAILTSAILQNDDLLRSWLGEVIQFRTSKTVWDVPSQKYVFALKVNQDCDVLAEASSYVDAVQHAMGNPHK